MVDLAYYSIYLIMLLHLCEFIYNLLSFLWGYISFFGISVLLSKLFCGELFDTFVILSAILLLINSPVASSFLELLSLKPF